DGADRVDVGSRLLIQAEFRREHFRSAEADGDLLLPVVATPSVRGAFEAAAERPEALLELPFPRAETGMVCTHANSRLGAVAVDGGGKVPEQGVCSDLVRSEVPADEGDDLRPTVRDLPGWPVRGRVLGEELLLELVPELELERVGKVVEEVGDC